MINCNKCRFLLRSPHITTIIYRCQKWGLQSSAILPSKIVAQSIGKPCPFYLEKKQNGQPDNNDDGIFV